MKGIIHGACDYLVKPVGLKELQNIWHHVVKKNIKSYAKNIGPSRQLLPPSESDLVPSVSKKRKDKFNDSGDEDDSDREEDDGEGSEQDGDESTRKKPRVVWSQELHQKFVNAVQQLGLDSEFSHKPVFTFPYVRCPLLFLLMINFDGVMCVIFFSFLLVFVFSGCPLQRLFPKKYLI